jgi:VWFA-related protein
MREPMIAAVAAVAFGAGLLHAQEAHPTFRARTERVVVAATVRTAANKPVTNLTAADFELYDAGERRDISEFRTDASPVSMALLVDFSGSMGVAARRQAAHDNVHQLLAWLTPGYDQAGLYVFDKQLRELQGLAPAPGDILAQLDAAERPFGVTSLYDAIAQTSNRVVGSAGSGAGRRAIVALTDGSDNASTLTAAEVSGIASSVDVPVYVIIVVSPYDRFGNGTLDDAGLARLVDGPLGNLARWTGGDIYTGIGPAQSSQAARSIVTELRQQYLIAFEPGTTPGWHRIQLRTRNKNLIVRARSGYFVGE